MVWLGGRVRARELPRPRVQRDSRCVAGVALESASLERHLDARSRLRDRRHVLQLARPRLPQPSADGRLTDGSTLHRIAVSLRRRLGESVSLLLLPVVAGLCVSVFAVDHVFDVCFARAEFRGPGVRDD